MLDGIDLDLNNGWISGITPLIASAWNPDTSIAEMLLDLGADVGPKPQGKTLETSTLCPIHVAAYYGNSSLIRSLIARGADCKVRYIMLTKLEWVDWRLEKLTNMLRWEWLAPLDLSSPLQFALESNNSHTIALLLHHLNPLEGGLDYDSALISEFTSEELDWHRIALYDKTPLAAAIKAGSEKIVRLYFHSGETYASTALHWAIIDAIESKNDSMFKLILGYRALEQIDECEASCLVLAIARCRWDLVYLLLCKPFLAGTSQSTYDNFDALSGPKWLPEAHLNYFTVGILTPLSAAMLSGNIDIVEAMIKCGYVPQETDVATLMGEDILAAVRTAVWSKFPLQSMSFECHRTMLTFAIKSKDKIKIQELIGLFPSLDFYIFRYRDVGYTPITLAAALGYIELVRLFLDAGANSYFISEVPQEYPVKWGHLMMGKMALKGTALEKAVRPKSTAVEVAASQGHLNIVDFLLNQQDVDLPTRMQGATEALGLVAGLGNLKMVKLLIERGADINASAAHVYDCTPLESAAINGRLDTVQFLLEKGAQLGGSMQMHYVRSIYFATKLGHFAIADHLKRCGYWGTEDQSIYRHFEKFNSERSRYIIDVENNLWEWIEEFSGWSSVNPFVHTTYPVPSENASDTEYRHDNGVQERVIKGAKDSPKTNDVVQQTSRPISLETSHEPPTVSVGRNITGIADMETGREGPLTGVNGPDRSGDFSEVVPVIERTPDFGIEDIDADTQSLLLNYVDEGWEGPFTNID
ncbi:ankyrin repeat-containing domain protein [Nemania abortiva]|nr:ankyrin repeat-containing domain protein [Nemania abortiva]